MIRNFSRLESVIGDKVGHLFLDHDTPIAIVKEMLFEFLTYVGNVEAQIKAQQAAILKSSVVEETAVKSVDETDSQPDSEKIVPMEQSTQAE